MASEVAMLSCPAKAGVRVRRRGENRRFAWGAAAFTKAGQVKCERMARMEPSRGLRAKKPAPQRPNGVFTQSIAARCDFAPMRPTRKSSRPPMRWPMRIAAATCPVRPLAARSAICPPTSISAMETAAPNQTSPFWNTDVPFALFSFMFTPYVGITQVRFEGSGPLGPLSARTRELPARLSSIIPQFRTIGSRWQGEGLCRRG